MSRRYSPEQVERCVKILGESARYEDALTRIRVYVAPGIDSSMLAKLFKRHGLRNPGQYLGHSAYTSEQVKAFGSQLSAKDWDVPVEWDDGEEQTQQHIRAEGPTTRIMVCPDAHHPYADRLAWQTFLAAAREWRPDRLIIIGDFADCLSVSFHPKDPSRRVGLKDELGAVNTELDAVERLRIPSVDFMLGNHELRLQRYLWERASELYGLIEIGDLLRIKERGWNVVPYRESLQIGKLHFAHDVGRCGKHTASQSLADYGHSIVVGHSHRAATIYGGTVHGERQVAMNVGTLIDISTVDYRHRAMAAREWQHGFGVIHMTGDGVGWCSFVPILDGRCVVDGRVISGRREAA